MEARSCAVEVCPCFLDVDGCAGGLRLAAASSGAESRRDDAGGERSESAADPEGFDRYDGRSRVCERDATLLRRAPRAIWPRRRPDRLHSVQGLLELSGQKPYGIHRQE